MRNIIYSLRNLTHNCISKTINCFMVDLKFKLDTLVFGFMGGTMLVIGVSACWLMGIPKKIERENRLYKFEPEKNIPATTQYNRHHLVLFCFSGYLKNTKSFYNCSPNSANSKPGTHRPTAWSWPSTLTKWWPHWTRALKNWMISTTSSSTWPKWALHTRTYRVSIQIIFG